MGSADFRNLDRNALREHVQAVVDDLRSSRPPREHARAIEAALAMCRSFYQHGRSREALTVARVALDQARQAGERSLLLRASTACGLLSADTLDLVGAIEHHLTALRIATEAQDLIEAARTWNNIGIAMGISGHYELAARCYRRSVDTVASIEEPVYSRYMAWSNLGHCLYRLGLAAEGLPYLFMSLEEETPGFREQDLLNALFVRRNLVRLLVACGRAPEAAPHLADCAALAERVRTPRAAIAHATALGTYEIARGDTDLALTRLDRALVQARAIPASLHDTLVTAIRAEEAAGNVERAVMRADELTEHVYRFAVDRAREHVELATLDAADATGQVQAQARARLAAMTPPLELPEAWQPLDRLAVNAAMRMDATGRHGKRVGTLVKSLAMANGCEPLQALEMGLAAEVHDIGMLSIPDGVLRKAGALSDAERGIVRRHVDAGVEMLAGDDRHPRVFMAREIARYHHARWDGEGQPAVGGNRIPLAARLCAVADAYDAMASGLGMREPRSMEEALKELHAEAGGQFDPGLVDCFDAFIRAESADLGMDLASDPGTEEFQALVKALQEDRGFV